VPSNDPYNFANPVWGRFLLGTHMPYEDELKRRAVNAYRQSDRSYRDVASEFGIAASTLSRWHYQTPTGKPVPPSSPYDAELVDVLSRLGKAADDGVKSYSRGQKHMQHLIIAAWILYVLVAVVLGLSVLFAAYRLFGLLPAEAQSQDLVWWLWMGLTTVAAFLAVGTVNGFLIRPNSSAHS
jgi:Transposase